MKGGGSVKHNATMNRIVAMWMIFCMMISCFGVSVSADQDSDIQTNGNISFEGFTFNYREDNSIQATADIYVENLAMTTMTIGLKYHDYIVPSELETNVDSTEADKVFKVTDENDISKYFGVTYTEIDPKEQTIYILLMMNQALASNDFKDAEVSADDVITNRLYSHPDTIDQWHINACSPEHKKVKIGTISFKVTDSAQLIKVPQEQIESRVLESIQASENEYFGTAARYSSSSTHYDALVTNSSVTITIDAQRTDASATIPRGTVSAYTLYKSCSEPSKAGTIDALYDYINRNMSRVKVTKASGTQSIGELIKWTRTDPEAANNAVIQYVEGIKPMVEETFDSDAETLNADNYSAKGNRTYMIKQPYMKDPEQIITIFLTVTPSELTGFEYDRRNMVFGKDEQPSINWEYLKMPSPITAVVTGVDDEYVPPTYEPNDETQWQYNHDETTSAASEGVTKLQTDNSYPITARFTTEFPKENLEKEPWLTIPADFDYTVDAYRYVIDNDSGEVLPPKDDDGSNTEIKAEIIYDKDSLETDMPGTLEITVTRLGGAAIADNTEFNIYLPNGWVLSSKESYVDVDIQGGTATIRVDAMKKDLSDPADTYNEAQRREIQSLINLGSENTFRLSELLPDDHVVESPLYRFSFNKRINRYLDDDTYFEYYVDESHKLIAPDHLSVETDPKTEGYIEKDYSEGRAGLFTVYRGQSLKDISSYIEFPDDSTIPVMYHGKDGYQPAELGAAKVKEDENGIAWHILDDDGADTIPTDHVGNITLVGTLEDYSYTNFDNVTNPQEIKLHLILTPIDPPDPSESPSPDASPTPEVTPDPDATPDPNASPSPVQGEAIEISTKVPPGNGAYKIVMNDKTFQFDTQNVGYSPSQRQTFTIKNIGSVDIAGLTMRIADITPDAEGSFDGSAANFTDSIPLDITKLAPDKTLTKLYSEQYNEIDVELRPLMSLPEGTYKARVIVGSRMNDDLAHFDIEFKVVSAEKELYTVTVNNYKKRDDPNSGFSAIGVAYLTDSDGTVYSKTYAAGDYVHATTVVTDTEGYEFDYWWSWNTDNKADVWSDNGHKDNPLSFQMPAHNLTIKPVFKEKTDLYLRLANLEDYTKVGTSGPDKKNDLRDTPTHIIENDPQFDETIHTYYVVVDYKDEDNYVKFGLKKWEKYDQMQYTVTLRYDGENEEHNIKDDGDVGVEDSDHRIVTHKSKDFQLKEGHNYVTITVTYSDGGKDYTQSYQVIIHRRKAEVDVRWRPGNSPYGLIAAQFADRVNSEDPTEASQAKDEELEAKQRFAENHSFVAFDGDDNAYTNKFTPLTAINTYNTYYSVEAWRDLGVYTDSSHNTINYDEVDEALFVYNKTTFVDPGFTAVYDDEGSQISAKDITREIHDLILIDEGQTLTNTDLIGLGSLTNLGSKLKKQSVLEIPDEGKDKDDGSCVITELQNLNVLPGVYSLVYKFNDETGAPATFERPLIILPEKGDINVNGKVDETDANILYNRLNDSEKGAPYTSFLTEVINSKNAWARLVSYRVSDLTEDRNTNSIDANAIRNGVTLSQYYEPLPTEKKTVDTPAENAPKTVWPGMKAAENRDGFTYTPPYTIPEEKPTLVLDYLGDGDVPQNKKYLSKPADLNSKKVWFGVGIKDPQKLQYFTENGIYSLDIAVDYDEDILVPCDTAGRLAGADGFDYAATINRYNIATSGDADNHDVTLWNNAELYTESLQTDLNLSSEDYGGDTKEDRYKSVFVTIRSKDGTSLRLKDLTKDNIMDSIDDKLMETDTIYLLRIPFLVQKEPPEGYTGLAVTINGITEQTFVMGAAEKGAPKGVSWEGADDKKTANLIKDKEQNAFNHFNGIDVQDLFGTDDRFTFKGSLHGWNPIEPFKIKFYLQNDDGATETLYKTFTSIENDLYTSGKTTVTTAEGEVTWDFELSDIPVAKYRVEYEKQAHLTYPYATVTPDDIVVDETTAKGTIEQADTFDMIVGDINSDDYIKDTDRAYLIHTFNQSRPWTPELTERFDRNDLNGDKNVNLFDLNLLNQNYEKSYPIESPGGEDEGGGP